MVIVLGYGNIFLFMTDINHLECTEVADVVYSISDIDVNADGIAEKTVDVRCVNNLEIYNIGYDELCCINKKQEKKWKKSSEKSIR